MLRHFLVSPGGDAGFRLLFLALIGAAAPSSAAVHTAYVQPDCYDTAIVGFAKQYDNIRNDTSDDPKNHSLGATADIRVEVDHALIGQAGHTLSATTWFLGRIGADDRVLFLLKKQADGSYVSYAQPMLVQPDEKDRQALKQAESESGGHRCR
jgi:hypothetical protein